ncbi:MAG: hypothetical protein NTX52_02175 [Planctomycetota bacterium]|nr:hypothetical protein [Planctomycetota bacterium]
MKLQDCRESYYYHSGKASDICRNLGLAGLALIWAFRVTSREKTIIPSSLRWASILLVGGLSCDFLHYLVGTVVWGVYHRYKEKRTSQNEEFLAPIWINYPANLCFFLKQIAIAIAYILLIISMFGSFWE